MKKLHYMALAMAEAKQALHNGDFPVGCVLVLDDAVLARAHRRNSFTTRTGMANEMDHAEVLALRQLLHDHPEVNPAGITAYSTMEPCLMCYATLLLSGIRSFVYAYEDVMGGGTNLALDTLNPLYRTLRVNLVPNICRAESLTLFQQYFADPRNDYWRDSLLARYTLEQKT